MKMTHVLVVPVIVLKSRMATVKMIALPFIALGRKNMTESDMTCQCCKFSIQLVTPQRAPLSFFYIGVPPVCLPVLMAVGKC